MSEEIPPPEIEPTNISHKHANTFRRRILVAFFVSANDKKQLLLLKDLVNILAQIL